MNEMPEINKTGNRSCVLFLIILLGFTGCFKEGGDCPKNGFRLQFVMRNPAHSLPDLFRTAHLYFYTLSGDLAGQCRLAPEDITWPEGSVFIQGVEYGEYKVVAVINESDYFETSGYETFEELTTVLAREGATPIPALLTGTADFTYEWKDKEKKVATIDLFKHTNHINLEVRLNSREDAESIRSHIEAANGAFHYASYSCPDNKIYTYAAEKTEIEGFIVQSKITTLRLWLEADVRLITTAVGNGGTPVNTLDVIELLTQVKDSSTGEYLYDTDEKLEYEDEYDIVITLDKTYAVLSVTVNGWDIVQGEVPVR